MIRKSAFIAWGPGRDTTNYVYPSLSGSNKASGPDDPMAAALAVLTMREQGIDRFLGATLAFASPRERADYRRVLQTGISELEALLQADGIL